MTTFETEHLTKQPPKNFDEMVAAMLKCEQTQGQSVYQHGQSVCRHYNEILHNLQNDIEFSNQWRVPDWLHKYKTCILNNLHQKEKVELYLLYHDCGKPYCRYVDEKMGTVHFPNHEAVSRHIWACVGGDDQVGLLIGNDMVVHTATAEEIDRKLSEEWSDADALTLLLAALSEVHSNAKLFGGIESNSFKMKWKKIDKRGRQICKSLFGD